jgi:NADH-quinone oxidoreductase subunit G
MRIEGRYSDAVNGFFICDRGRFGFDYVNGGASHDKRPRRARIGGREVDLDAALRAASEKIVQIGRESDSRAVGCLGSTRGSLETLGMLKRLCKEQGWMEPAFFTDRATAVKVKSAVSKLDERVAVSLRDIERADFIVAVGVDPICDAPMLALAMRQAFRKGASVVVIDPRPVFLPLGFEHLAVSPRRMDACLSVLIRRGLARENIEGREASALGFFGGLPNDYPFDSSINDRIGPVAEKLEKSRRPVIICGTDIVSETTPALAADLALFLGAGKDHSGLFYTMDGANGFGAALLSSKEVHSFSDILEAIENGTTKILLVVESDPFRFFPDRERLEAAFKKLDHLIVLDYLPSKTVAHADIFLPTSTIFEEISSFINQEGRLQHAEAVDVGGIPIWGSHPPRVYSDRIPGGDPTEAWRILQGLGHNAVHPMVEVATESPFQWIADESPALVGLRDRSYSIDSMRVIPERSSESSFSSLGVRPGVEEEKRSEDLLQLLLVDWTFGTEELSSYSDIIWPVEQEPCITMHAEDAKRADLAHGDRVLLELDRGGVEVKVCVSEKMARGVIVLPRHRKLEWQKIKSSSAMVSLSGVRKMQAAG